MHIVYIYLVNELTDGLSNRRYLLTSTFHYSMKEFRLLKLKLLPREYMIQ
jgi:hypothetical protein